MSNGDAPKPDYSVLAQSQVDEFDPNVDTVVTGWRFRILWTATGATFSVFVPGAHPPPADVDKAIRDAGVNVQGYADLGA